MASIFKWLFGRPSPGDAREAQTAKNEHRKNARLEPEPEIIRIADPSLPGKLYFVQLERLTSSVSAKDYSAAVSAARASLPLLREWLNDPRSDGQRLDIQIPALSQGGTMMAITGDRDGLSELRELVQDFDYLEAYREMAEEHFADLYLFERIRNVIRSKPGVLQNQIKADLDINDGRRVSRLVSYLEKSGEIQRARNGKTYELYMADFEMPEAASATIYTEPANPGSHRHDTWATKPGEFDLKDIHIAPLPPSPDVWEHPASLPGTKHSFEDPHGVWSEVIVEPIKKESRPDPAFRRHYSIKGGILSFDDRGNSDASIGAPGAVIFSDGRGRASAPVPLHRDAYHISVHPEGDGFAIRSKSGVLTVYNGDLKVDFETDLRCAPEVVANRKRLCLTENETNHDLRCVALTPKRDRYVFTHVDEAWCISRDGKRLWGLRMPEKMPDHQRIQISFGTAAEIDESLKIMGLEMPVKPDEIRKRYRHLARELHPDINPDSEEQMKQLNIAAEKLTGLDPEQLNGSAEHGGSLEVRMVMSPSYQVDWIYTAAFSWTGETALLGTYDGRVMRVDENGMPLVIYDVGSMPVRIVETEEFLYIKTSTRLYVLDGDRLMAMEDCSPKSDLIFGGGMVLLIENKGVRVFADDGRPLGVALTKAPIRRAYVEDREVVIETRTQRARFCGVRRPSRNTSTRHS